MKKSSVLGILLIFCLLVNMLPVSVGAAQTTCNVYVGSNVEMQNYTVWTSPIESYLAVCDDGTLMRVQVSYNIEGVLVEYYDAKYNFLYTKTIPEELPIFGGFYETNSNYFLVTGQANFEESDDVEVFRITKYDKEWNRIADCRLYGHDTSLPFRGGTVRMETMGKYLLIYTCHEQYRSADGYNHQASMSIVIDMETMNVPTDVKNTYFGRTSHSLNQFIHVDGEKVITLDHGDGYPRSIVLHQNQMDGGYSNTIDVFFLAGDTGVNKTGASVGGFGISDHAYLVAGNSVVQDENNLSRTTRNIFVAVMEKSTSNVSVNWITNYEEGNGTTSTPYLVPISADSYLLLWSREDVVYYTKIDAHGNQIGEINNVSGNLSDCEPICVNGKLVWYTWENEINTFYEIDLKNLEETAVITLVTGHDYMSLGTKDERVSLKCTKCNDEQNPQIVTKYIMWWQKEDGYYYTIPPANNQQIGSQMEFWISNFTPDDADTNAEMVIEISNPDVISCQRTISYNGMDVMGNFTMLKEGTATIRIYPKYNLTLVKEYNFIVTGDTMLGDVNSDGGLNAKDVASLRRYLAGGWNVTIDEIAADVNEDGVINAKDVAMLRRYLAGGWGTDLG